MALQVWLPLNGDMKNKGLANVTATPAGGTASYNASGKIGSCLSCNGSTFYNISPINLGSEATIAWWEKTSTAGKVPWTLVTDASSYGMTVWGSSNGFYYTLNTGDGNNDPFKDANNNNVASIQDGNWNHFAVTFGNNVSKLYINGEYAGRAVTFKSPAATNKVLRLAGGSNNAHNYDFNGSLNDFRIYDNCLSVKEVKELSQALVVHYKLDSVKNNILPPGIELYDSIQGDGNSTIYTSIPYDSTKSTYKIKCKFSQPANVANWDSVFAAYTDENSKTIRIIRGNSNNLMYMYYNNKAGNGNPVVFNTSNANIKEVTITSTNVVCIENGTTDTHSFGAPSGTDTQSTFNLIRNSKSVIYYWTIWDGDTMVGNFLPATFYGEPGMWDTVTKKFFHNEGTGTFILGNKITIKEYEYIQCDTASYIKSGVIPTTSTNFEMKYEVNSLSAENVYFGCTTASAFRNGNNYSLDILTSGSLLYTFKNLGYDTSPYTTTANTPFVVRLQGDTFSINGNPMPANRHTSHPNLEIYLFARNVNGTVGSIRYGKLYYCKFWESYNLIRDFIPVSYNGTLGLFDKVEMKFYPNAGSGTFTAGTIVSEIVEDCSGYGRDAVAMTNLSLTSSSPRYNMYASNTANYPLRATFDFPTSDGLTVACWVNMSTWGWQGSGIFSTTGQIAATPTDYNTTTFNHYDGKIYLRGTDGTTYNINLGTTSTSDVPVNVWKHVVFTHDGSTVKLYINGSLVRSKSVPTPLVAFKRLYLGTSFAGGTNRNCLGKWSDFRMYATALSEEDVKELYNTSTVIDDKGDLMCYQGIEQSDNFLRYERTKINLNPANTNTCGKMTTRNGVLAMRFLPTDNWFGTNDERNGKMFYDMFKENTRYVFDMWIDADNVATSSSPTNQGGGFNIHYTDGTASYALVVYGANYGDTPMGFQHRVYISEANKTIKRVSIRYAINASIYVRADSFIAEVADTNVYKTGNVATGQFVEGYDVAEIGMADFKENILLEI